ncbi:RNA polymerase sigma factor [Streptomyces sp. NPDC057592]|uniref:RNA polymerase sigma factor n=1 Tax=unclassified Streptomyces TaxID=2593676 RepID=UPI0036D11BF0
MTESEWNGTNTLESLYKEGHGELVGRARKLLAMEGLPESASSAEDIVQTAFDGALRNADQIRDHRAYVFSVIRREVTRAALRHRGESVLIEKLSRDPAQASPAQSEDVATTVVCRVVTREALRKIPTQQRTAVYAAKALGLTQRETAAAMGTAMGIVATHVNRGMLTMYSLLVLAGALIAGLLMSATETVESVTGGGGREICQVKDNGDVAECPVPSIDPSSDGTVSVDWLFNWGWACLIGVFGFLLILVCTLRRSRAVGNSSKPRVQSRRGGKHR